MSSSAAWEWIGIRREDLAAVPRLSAALKNVVGSKEEIIEALRKSETVEARKILDLIDNCPSSKYIDYLPFEAFCLKVKVPTKRFFSIIAEVLFEESQNEALLIVNQGIPEIAEATVKAAKEGKFKQQQILLQHAGIAPIPKGTTITINNPRIDQSTKNLQVVMPPAEDAVKKMSERFNQNVTPPLLPGEVVDVYAEESEEGE